MTVSDTGNTLGAILCKRLGCNAMMGVFGDSLIWVPFNATDSCLSIKDKIDSVAQREERSKNGALAIKGFTRGAGVGGGTETGLWWALHDLTEKKVKVDRIIMLSDLCCYTQGDVNCGYKMSDYFGKNGEKATVQSMIDRYRREVNPGCFAYSINLHGYGQSQLKPSGDRNYLLSGWSRANLLADGGHGGRRQPEGGSRGRGSCRGSDHRDSPRKVQASLKIRLTP